MDLKSSVVAVATLAVLAGCGSQPAVEKTATAPAAAATPVATPTPTPAAVAPVTLTGTGSKVTDPIAVPKGLWRLSWRADGRGNFIVMGHGQQDAVLVNAILPDPSSGEAPFQSITGSLVLAIQADQASWTITLTRVSG